jgi:hypothetical protein
MRTKSNVIMQYVVVCWSLLLGVPHKIAFLKTVWHYAGKSGTQKGRTVSIDGISWLTECGFYERGDKLTLFWSICRYFCTILTFCGTAKKERLLGENYKYFNSFVKFRGILVWKHAP